MKRGADDAHGRSSACSVSVIHCLASAGQRPVTKGASFKLRLKKALKKLGAGNDKGDAAERYNRHRWSHTRALRLTVSLVG